MSEEELQLFILTTIENNDPKLATTIIMEKLEELNKITERVTIYSRFA